MKIGVENFKLFEQKVEFNLNKFIILTGPNGSGKTTMNTLLHFMHTNFANGPKFNLDTSCLINHSQFTKNIRLENLNRLNDPITFHYNDVTATYIYNEQWNQYEIKNLRLETNSNDDLIEKTWIDSDHAFYAQINIESYKKMMKRKHNVTVSNTMSINETYDMTIRKENSISFVKHVVISEIDSLFKFNYHGYKNLIKTYNSNSIPLQKTYDSVETTLIKFNKLSAADTKSIEWINKTLNIIGFQEKIYVEVILEDIFKIYLTKNNKHKELHELSKGEFNIIMLVLFIASNIESENDYSLFPFIFLEEPETALHPNYQSKLADLICQIKNFPGHDYHDTATHVLIETHSEYFIRKLQFNIAINKVSKDDISLYYFHKIKDDSVLPYLIEFKKDGSLSREFGSGFFDEADNVAIELFKIKKSQNN